MHWACASDKASTLISINAVASFPAEQHTEASTSVSHTQHPLYSHPRHHCPLMFRPFLVCVTILVVLGHLCLASSSTLGPCRHQGKSAYVPAFNCFEVTAFGEPPDCRLLGFSGALALAAASARIDDSVDAAPAPTESPISMELTNTVVKRYAGYCVLTWA